MKTTSYTELRSNLKNYLNGVVVNSEPLIIQHPGKQGVVVIHNS